VLIDMNDPVARQILAVTFGPRDEPWAFEG
jgi:hypothetical protein